MKITLGLPAKITFTLADYSAADGWSLSGTLSNGTTTETLASGLFESSATDSTEWTLSIPAATTAAYTAADYTLYVVASASGESDVLAMERAAQVVALGTVSHNRKMVTAIQALMEGRTDKAYESLTTADGQSITRLDPEKLVYWLRHYRRQLAAEVDGSTGSASVKTIQMGFSR